MILFQCTPCETFQCKFLTREPPRFIQSATTSRLQSTRILLSLSLPPSFIYLRVSLSLNAALFPRHYIFLDCFLPVGVIQLTWLKHLEFYLNQHSGECTLLLHVVAQITQQVQPLSSRYFTATVPNLYALQKFWKLQF